MPVSTSDFLLIETDHALETFEKENETIDWLCFDTEFVGERRYFTRLCLIQVATENGIYLIDPFKVKKPQCLLDWIENPDIIKITHAGDNDYRLLNASYGIVPKNTFDTQIAAGLAGYKYPISFRKLVEQELRLYLNKGYAVADWEGRPFRKKQLRYALNDVKPLYDLWQSLTAKLEERERMHWAREEFGVYEVADFYIKDPYKEALNSNLIRALNTKEQIFLLRLFSWRQETAKKKDYSKEMVLPGKIIGQIIRSINSGKDALKQNRRIPDKFVDRYGDIFQELFLRPATEEEKNVLKQIPKAIQEDPREEVLNEMLYLLIKYKCMRAEVSPAMVMPKNLLKKITSESHSADVAILDGWRSELLGEEFIGWIKNFDRLDLDINGGEISLHLRE